jgi:hypothetical protein
VGPWAETFLGVSAALGEPLEESLQALDPAGRQLAADLEASLRSPLREVRARSIARIVAEVVIGLDEMRLR